MGQKVDAVIIGAGVIGTATAFELGKRGYKTLNIDKLPVGRLRPDVELVRDRARPLLVVRRRGDGVRGLLLLEELGRVPRGAGRVGPRQVHAVGHGPARERDRATTTRCCRTTTASACPYEEWDTATLERKVPIFDVHEFWPPSRPSDDDFAAPRTQEAPGRDLHARLGLRQRSGALLAQPAARRRGQGRAVPLPPQGDRDPPGRRQGARRHARRRQRDRREDRRQRRGPALVRDQPHGGRRGRHEDQDEGAAPRGAPRPVAARASTTRRTATTSPTATTPSTSGPRRATTS